MSNIISALNALDVASLSYQEWVQVGMALQAEGYDCSVWESWSRNDRRYHPGECERKWRTFRTTAGAVKGACACSKALSISPPGVNGCPVDGFRAGFRL